MASIPQSTGPVVRVRVAAPSDAALLASLGARLFEQTFGPDNTPEDMRLYLASAFSERVQREELSDAARIVWIAEDPAARPIGYAILHRGEAGPGVVGARPAEVQRVYADREWHGHGIGAMLMRACVEQARAWNSDVIWLCVWEKNPRAIAFYEKSGFRAVGRQRFVLGLDIQSDLVMALPL